MADVLGRVLYEDAGVMILAKEPEGEAVVFSEDVLEIEYEHVDDADDVVRYHEFKEGVRAVALPGNMAVLLVRERGRIWEDF